ncbi:hypothetical protein SAMN05216207_102766 [Pseudonocardia ammonioxydans]|uniref:Uncharacterized protein n=1 Tax=Pseudonocardia ammonioxydans TaxID=260086 RepID=A0A1I5DSS3_PSUAM|nr:hypothetical protein [Pseudonocardia ammonioxydans]SFO02315.1 hypothetical protein SAMN05216207_102766 [Pseudonocardia ammonioxydans]
MSPFRLFGRRARPAGDEPDPWLDDPAPATAHSAAAPGPAASARTGPPGHPGAAPTGPPGHAAAAPGRPAPAGTGDSPAAWAAAPAGPATTAARPSLWTAQRPPQGEPAEPEPVTDPFGFAPVPPPRPRTDDPSAGWAPRSPGGEQVVAHRTGQPPAPRRASAVDEPDDAGRVVRTGGHAAPPAPTGAGYAARQAGRTAPSLTDGADHAGPPATGVTDTGTAPERRASDHAAPSTTGEAEDATPPTSHTTSRATPRSAGAGYVAPPAPAACRPDPGAPSTADATEDETAPTAPAADPPDGIDPAEASALAGAFAADLLSWDEDDPARRGRALGTHLASPEGAALLGWTGTGRQRADLVLPGRVRPDGDRVHVDVRVRVVPYRRVDARTPGAPEPEPTNPLGGPAAAPAPAARGWRGLGARWVRLEVAVVRTGGRLVVDAEPVGDPSGPSPAALAGRAPGRSR